MSEEAKLAHYDRAVQLLSWRRWKEATKEIEQFISYFPEDPDGYGLLGKIYLDQDQFDKAYHWGQEAIKLDPESEMGWFVTTGVLYTKEDWQPFSEMIEEALRIFPNEDHYFFLRGNYFNKKGQIVKGKEDLESALRIDPENGLYLANYSYVLSLLGEFEKAKDFERQALQIDVENSMPFMYLSWSAEHRRDYDSALNYLQNAIRLDPEDEQIRKEYLQILQKQYRLYQILAWPSKLSYQKHWVIILVFITAGILFRPLFYLFLFLYIATHWITKLLVHVKVFGWFFRK